MNTAHQPSTTLIARNPVKAALALCEKPIVREDEITANLKKVDAALSRLGAHSENLFGIESGAKDTLGTQQRELNRRRAQLLNMKRFGGHYAVFSTEPLRWRNKQGWPKLAAFGLNSPAFELSAKMSWRGWDSRRRHYTETLTSQNLREFYQDVLAKLTQIAKAKRKTVKLTTQFVGLIPAEVRSKIVEARKHFGDNIYIVAEVTDWKVQEINVPTPAPIRYTDPLVVGHDKANDCYWLIASFDLTPLEEYVKLEFTV